MTFTISWGRERRDGEFFSVFVLRILHKDDLAFYKEDCAQYRKEGREEYFIHQLLEEMVCNSSYRIHKLLHYLISSSDNVFKGVLRWEAHHNGNEGSVDRTYAKLFRKNYPDAEKEAFIISCMSGQWELPFNWLDVLLDNGEVVSKCSGYRREELIS